jgi:hyperosmotically inducible protein
MTTDASLTAKVTTALQADAEVGGLDIGVRTENGIVTLTGSGLDAAKSERAMQIAKSVDGVKGVLGNFS